MASAAVEVAPPGPGAGAEGAGVGDEVAVVVGAAAETTEGMLLGRRPAPPARPKEVLRARAATSAAEVLFCGSGGWVWSALVVLARLQWSSGAAAAGGENQQQQRLLAFYRYNKQRVGQQQLADDFQVPAADAAKRNALLRLPPRVGLVVPLAQLALGGCVFFSFVSPATAH